MSQVPKAKPLECTDLMMRMTLSTVRDYLGLALSAKDMNAAHRCEMSLGFVKDALELLRKLERCWEHAK